MDEDLIYESVNETCSPKLSNKPALKNTPCEANSLVERSPPYGEESPVEGTSDILHNRRFLSPVSSLGLPRWSSNSETEFCDAYEDPASVREKKVSISPSVKSDMYLSVMDADREEVYDNPVENTGKQKDVEKDEGKRFSLAELHRGSNDSTSNLVTNEYDLSPTASNTGKFSKRQVSFALQSDKDIGAEQEQKYSTGRFATYVKNHFTILSRIMAAATFVFSLLAVVVGLLAVFSALPDKCKCPVASQDINSTEMLTTLVKATLESVRLHCPSSWVEYRNSCYSPVMIDEKGFVTASKSCHSYGGFLPTIKSAEENRFITENIVKTSVTDAKALLIGLTADKRDASDSFVWASGAKVTFLNNLLNISASETRKCFAVNSTGEWTATDCLRSTLYFCKRPIIKYSKD